MLGSTDVARIRTQDPLVLGPVATPLTREGVRKPIQTKFTFILRKRVKLNFELSSAADAARIRTQDPLVLSPLAKPLTWDGVRKPIQTKYPPLKSIVKF